MHYEYFLLNILILAGPISLSFDRRVYFIQYYKSFLAAILLTMVPFLLWDILVAGKHWWFNQAYTLNMQILGLPIGEWLFFITVPYACLFSWQVLQVYFEDHSFPGLKRLFWPLSFILFIFAFWALLEGKAYTFLALTAFTVSLIMDKIFKINLLQRRLFYVLLAILFILILIFNGYLTARPVVLYEPRFQLDIHIGTIPVEDFIYGYALIISNITLFERFKRKFNA